jgi:hypothetical protein
MRICAFRACHSSHVTPAWYDPNSSLLFFVSFTSATRNNHAGNCLHITICDCISHVIMNGCIHHGMLSSCTPSHTVWRNCVQVMSLVFVRCYPGCKCNVIRMSARFHPFYFHECICQNTQLSMMLHQACCYANVSVFLYKANNLLQAIFILYSGTWRTLLI